MKKAVFWLGVAVLVVGIVVFSYAYMTIQNINATAIRFMGSFLNPNVESQLFLAQILQSVGLGLLALGAIILLYGVFS
jgi:hypothetical protein